MKTTIVLLSANWSISCWWPILLFMLGAFILGWLLGRLCKKCKTDDAKYNNLLADYKVLDKKLADCESNKQELVSQIQSFAKTVSIPNYQNQDLALAAKIMDKKIKIDDLKLVEGIGPKIEELFHSAGLKTWWDISQASSERLKEILNNGGTQFKMHEPGTWPKQCLLMVEGKWEELKKWQDELDGGKEA